METQERVADGTIVSSIRSPLPGSMRITVSVVISMGCILIASYFWALHVEPWFGWITKAAEETMMGKGHGAETNGKTVLPVRKE